MTKRTHIVIAEPSFIIRRGVVALLHTTTLNADIAELPSIEQLEQQITDLNPDILIINPNYLGHFSLGHLKNKCGNDKMRVMALQVAIGEPSILKEYDGIVSIYDNADTIQSVISTMINTDNEDDSQDKLSSREKEVLVCITKGMTNKEIADQLYLSIHTVVSHRRNISSKLDIHSPAGLTIYAIVNKLIDSQVLSDSMRS